MAGNLFTIAVTSPSGKPDSSISNFTSRKRLKRLITAGPLAISSVATCPSMTEPTPGLVLGTMSRSSRAKSVRASSASLTTMGTCRPGKFSFGRAAL